MEVGTGSWPTYPTIKLRHVQVIFPKGVHGPPHAVVAAFVVAIPGNEAFEQTEVPRFIETSWWRRVGGVWHR